MTPNEYQTIRLGDLQGYKMLKQLTSRKTPELGGKNQNKGKNIHIFPTLDNPPSKTVRPTTLKTKPTDAQTSHLSLQVAKKVNLTENSGATAEKPKILTLRQKFHFLLVFRP